MFAFLLDQFLLPFIMVTALYLVNIAFLSQKTMRHAKLWEISIIVVNIMALCLSIVVVLLPIVVITAMSFGTGLTSIKEVVINLEIVQVTLVTLAMFLYFILLNIVLTILTAKKSSKIEKMNAT